MRKFLIVVFFLPLGCYCHTSTLRQILNANGDNITTEFGCLSADSNAADEVKVCYGTGGEMAKRSEFDGAYVFNSNGMPRCHSEFYLLRKIKERNISINNCTIHIENSKWPPCSTNYRGRRKDGKIEHNPGITCDKYLSKFAQDENCTILVEFPSDDVPWIYLKE